ncbi:MAG: hypothetical protein ACI9G1_002458 [Pirellulaceae bacterium]|jgi:hypothetical protein
MNLIGKLFLFVWACHFCTTGVRAEDVRARDKAKQSHQKLEAIGGSFLWGGKELRIGSKEFTDDKIALLATLDPPLTMLSVYGSGLTSACLPEIGKLTTLEQLSLSLPDIKDADVAALASLTNLGKLTLRSDTKEGISLTPAGFSKLKALTKVEHLGIGGHAFPPAVLAAVPDVFPQIKTLDMNHTFSNNAETLRAFAKFEHLERIVLGGNPWLPKDAMAEVGNIRTIRELNLVHTGEKDFGTVVRSLQGHPNLRKIEMAVRGDQLTDDLIPIFLTIPNLEEFTFGNDKGPLTDAAVATIAKHPNIRVLKLSHPSFTNKAAELLSRMAGLEELLVDCESFSDAAFAPLKDISKLRVLNIGSYFRGPAITDAVLPHLAELKGIERISLFLHSNASFSNESLEKLQAALPKAEIKLRWKEVQ